MSESTALLNLDFLKQTINPRAFKTGPPALLDPSVLQKSVEVNLHTAVATMEPAPDQTPIVSNQTGLVLWFPKRGYNSVLHMGIIPKGSVAWAAASYDDPAAVGTGMGPPIFTPTIDTAGDFVTGQVSGVKRFVFASALAVPRIYDKISFAPNLRDDFTYARVVGGVMEMHSSTIATGKMVLNGQMTTAVVSDSTGVAQSSDGSGAYTVASLYTAARTKKEYVGEKSAADGVLSVVGSDISSHYPASDPFSEDSISGPWVEFSANVPQTATVTNPTSNGPATFSLFSMWTSPWNVECYDWDGRPGPPFFDEVKIGIGSAGPVKLPPVSEFAVPDIRLRMQIEANPSPGVGGYHMLNFAVTAFFASCTDSKSGACKIQQVVVRRSVPYEASFFKVAYPDTSTMTSGNNAYFSFDFTFEIGSEVKAAGGVDVLGKYIGSRISLTDSLIVAGGNGTSIVYKMKKTGVFARLRQHYEPGNIGPVHVLRYDNIGAGQTLHASGTLNIQCVPKASIASYIQKELTKTQMAGNASMLSLLYNLYNVESSPFKCSWERSEWKSFVEEYLKRLDIPKIRELAYYDDRVKASAEASDLTEEKPDAGAPTEGPRRNRGYI